MGNWISSSSKVAPISAASTILSFISFPITAATLVKVLWEDIQVLQGADAEVADYLGNLKQALYEERAHLRLVRRRHRGEFDEGAFSVLANAIRHMIRDFKRLEEPFLDNPPDLYDRDGKYALDQADPEDYYDTRYKRMGFSERYLWLRTRGHIVALEKRLALIQTRRIAKQTADIAIDQHYQTRVISDLEDRVSALEDKLHRVVGVRHVD